MLQPPDFGFIKCFKQLYRKHTFKKKKYTEWIEEQNIELKVNVVQMLHFTVLTQKQLDCHWTSGNKNPSLLSLTC